MSRPQLYHLTCSHGLRAIERAGWVLRPQVPWPAVALGIPTGLLLAPPVTWLTDDPSLPAEALGLTAELVSCDRTEHTLTLPPGTPAWPWRAWAVVHRANPAYVAMLGHGRTPRAWYVTEQPVQLEVHP